MTPQLTISQLRHFLLVAELGSFHAAADKAHRTQPAISLSVRELENKLGGALFERGRNGTLTPLGEQCLPLVRELIRHYDFTMEEMDHFAESRSGTVSVAAVPSIAGRLLPEPLARFSESHPDVRLRLVDANSQEVQKMVLRGAVDFGLTSIWEATTELNFEALLTDRIGLVCRNDHALATDPAPLPWQALAGQRMIRNGTTRLVDGTAAENVVADSPIFIPNMISLIAMLEAGAGITTLPFLAFPAESERLIFRDLVEPLIQRQLGILQPAQRSLSPAAQALRAELANTLLRRGVPANARGPGSQQSV